MGLTVGNLEHFTIVSHNVAESKRFYVEVLGATAIEREFPPCVRLGTTDIDIFAATGEQQPAPGPLNQHHAFRIPLADYDAWVERFQQHGVPTYRATHGKRRMSVYVQDPDGYHVELTVAFDTDEEGSREIEKRGLANHINPARTVRQS